MVMLDRNQSVLSVHIVNVGTINNCLPEKWEGILERKAHKWACPVTPDSKWPTGINTTRMFL